MSAEPAVEAVVVSVKDNSFIPEIITAPWKPGSNIFVTFQNDDDFEHILECRDYFEFPLVTLCAGHVVTYAFDNVGRFEITSKHNGCMKVLCVIVFYGFLLIYDEYFQYIVHCGYPGGYSCGPCSVSPLYDI